MFSLTGRELEADEALRLGLIAEAATPESLTAATTMRTTLMARLPREMPRMRQMCLNRVYEMQGLRTAIGCYLEQATILGALPVVEYRSSCGCGEGSRTMLASTNVRYEGL